MSIHECKPNDDGSFCRVCGLTLQEREMEPVYSPREAMKKADEMILKLGFTSIRELGDAG